MLGYKAHSLVAFYDIWPGNRAGLFLQARSPVLLDTYSNDIVTFNSYYSETFSD